MRLRTVRNLPAHVVMPKTPQRPIRSLSDLPLTERKGKEPRALMAEALVRANEQGIDIDGDGIHPATIRALKNRGLIHKRISRKGRTSWRTTDAGRHICCYHEPVYLHRSNVPGTTTDEKHAMRGEPEVIAA